MVEDVAAILPWIAFALGRNHDLLMVDGVNHAVVENGLGIAEDEIHVAFDVAILEILARRPTGSLVSLAGAAGGEQSVLCAEKTHVAEDSTVPSHGKRDGLRALRLQTVLLAEVILESEIGSRKVVCCNKDSCREKGTARTSRAVGIHDDGFRGIVRQTLKANMRLGYTDHFTVNAWLDQNRATILAKSINSLLDATIVAAAVGCRSNRLSGSAGWGKRSRLFIIEGLALRMDHWFCRERHESGLAGEWSWHFSVARRRGCANVFAFQGETYSLRAYRQPGMAEVYVLGGDVIHEDAIQLHLQEMVAVET